MHHYGAALVLPGFFRGRAVPLLRPCCAASAHFPRAHETRGAAEPPLHTDGLIKIARGKYAKSASPGSGGGPGLFERCLAIRRCQVSYGLLVLRGLPNPGVADSAHFLRAILRRQSVCRRPRCTLRIV